jgi:hypothetical protein
MSHPAPGHDCLLVIVAQLDRFGEELDPFGYFLQALPLTDRRIRMKITTSGVYVLAKRTI